MTACPRSAAVTGGPIRRGDCPETVLVLVLALCLASIGLLGGPSALTMGALALVLAGGLPHGALDATLLTDAAHRSGIPQATGWALYAAAALATLGFALVLPGPALLAFVALSVWHFADSDTLSTRAAPLAVRCGDRLTRGLLPICGPLTVAPDAARDIGLQFGPSWAVHGIVAAGPAGLAISACGCLLSWSCAGNRRTGTTLLAECAAVLAACIVAGPLGGFAAYFTGLHAVRHHRRVAVRRELPRREAAKVAVATAVPIVGILVAVGAQAEAGAAAIAGETARATFLALFALTVPHVALNRLRRFPHEFQRKERMAPPSRIE